MWEHVVQCSCVVLLYAPSLALANSLNKSPVALYGLMTKVKLLLRVSPDWRFQSSLDEALRMQNSTNVHHCNITVTIQSTLTTKADINVD